MIAQPKTLERAQQLYLDAQIALHRSTDRLFGYLMVCQYIGAVIWAFVNSPQTWEGRLSQVHPHVFTAILLGGLISIPTVALAFFKPGAAVTRWTISVCQMLMSALLIHVSGGQIETHFHVFGSLAFLAFYRDWRLLIPATLVVLADHIILGIYAPISIYGVASGAEWRFLGHAAWVVFENIILVASCVRGVREMHIIADRQALLESTYAEVETLVQVRTQELERSQERKTAIFDNAMDGIVSMDANGDITEFNPAAESMFQIAKGEAMGKQLAEFVAPEEPGQVHSDTLDQFFGPTDGNSLNRRIEVTGLRTGGEAFPVELSIVPVSVGSDVVFTAFIRDLAERRRLETKLAHAQKMESIGQLAAGIAHEINTPNQYIGDNIRFLEGSLEGLTEALGEYRKLHESARTDGTNPEQVAKLDETVERTDLDFVLEEVPQAIVNALDGVERVASIVRAMKDFSHPGQESQTTVDLNRVIDSTVTVARSEWKYCATIEMDLDPHLPHVQGHPGALGQVVLNLIINAAHAIKERYGDDQFGLIKIASRTVGDHVEVTFSDDGCGIPDHAQARVFEPFYTTKRVGIGTGQGLAISHSVICDGHHGQLEFITAPNEGTTFTIRLPFESAQEEAA